MANHQSLFPRESNTKIALRELLAISEPAVANTIEKHERPKISET
jgi:hypothetical protein